MIWWKMCRYVKTLYTMTTIYTLQAYVEVKFFLLFLSMVMYGN